MKNSKPGAPYLAYMALHAQFVKEAPLAGISGCKVSHNNTGSTVTQVAFSSPESLKHVYPCLVNDPYNGVVTKVAGVIEMTHLDLKVVVKLVLGLFFKFDAWHPQYLHQMRD